MFCPSCGNEVPGDLKYCNRCGANLTLTYNSLPVTVSVPVKLTAPTLIMGLTIVGGLGVIFAGATELAQLQVNWAAITWIVLFSMLTLFGSTGMLLRFWSKTLSLRQNIPAPTNVRTTAPPAFVPQQLPPRYDPTSSVTEHTTRTFTPIYREPSEPS
jgi:hypothetical protein